MDMGYSREKCMDEPSRTRILPLPRIVCGATAVDVRRPDSCVHWDRNRIIYEAVQFLVMAIVDGLIGKKVASVIRGKPSYHYYIASDTAEIRLCNQRPFILPCMRRTLPV